MNQLVRETLSHPCKQLPFKSSSCIISGMEHLMVARGAWDDFKASLKKAGSKVKNAFGKKNEEEEGRQFEGFGVMTFPVLHWDHLDHLLIVCLFIKCCTVHIPFCL